MSETDRRGIDAVKRELELEYETDVTNVTRARRPGGPPPQRAETRRSAGVGAVALAFVLGCLVGGAIAALAIAIFVLSHAPGTAQLGAAPGTAQLGTGPASEEAAAAPRVTEPTPPPAASRAPAPRGVAPSPSSPPADGTPPAEGAAAPAPELPEREAPGRAGP